MKRIFKRNQIVITFLAVMIAVAGYINYISSIDKESAKANADVEKADEYVDIYSNDNDIDEISLMEPGTAVMTSTDIGTSAMISEVKLNREQLRAANKETLYQIIDNQNLDEAAKQSAINEMIHMTEVSEKEMAAELLLEAKGFGECIVTIVDGSVDVVVNTAELDDVSRAQIEDIVKRKTDVSADQIVISPIAAVKTAE
ncbi:MAG: SpoIIIAH-like family protein [Lachnospiraceae bacterium]